MKVVRLIWDENEVVRWWVLVLLLGLIVGAVQWL
jgi:hypothetical protein